MIARSIRIVGLMALSCTSVFADKARWADASIPFDDGLELWLDGSRENEAREAHYMNRLADGQPHDGVCTCRSPCGR